MARILIAGRKPAQDAVPGGFVLSAGICYPTTSDMPSDAQPPLAPPVRSEDGVDLTLIRWFLSLTPAERLESLENFVNGVLMIRGENAGH
jgi:hypothetical protein